MSTVEGRITPTPVLKEHVTDLLQYDSPERQGRMQSNPVVIKEEVLLSDVEDVEMFDWSDSDGLFSSSSYDSDDDGVWAEKRAKVIYSKRKRGEKPINQASNLSFNNYFTQNDDILECFRFYFDDDFVEAICTDINRRYRLEKRQIQDWEDVSPSAFNKFLALSLLMARVLKLSLSEYWSQNILLETPIFRKVMSEAQYRAILSMLSFHENKSNTIGYTITNIVEHTRKKYQEALMKKYDSEDGLLFLKNRLFLKQYIFKNKNNHDPKIFVLCDSMSGYVIDFVSYKQNDDITEDCNSDVDVLLSNYFKNGHNVFLDNYWNSPDLFLWLYCKARKQVINNTGMGVMERELKKETVNIKCLGNTLCLKWLKDGGVWILSPLKSNQGQNNPPKSFYFREKEDVRLRTTMPIRKSKDWNTKYFFQLLDLTVANAWTVYEGVNNKLTKQCDFHLELVRQLLEKCHGQVNETEGHFPDVLPTTGKKINPTKRCTVCKKHKIRKETRYMCETCKVPLCIVPCFKIYHTVIDY